MPRSPKPGAWPAAKPKPASRTVSSSHAPPWAPPPGGGRSARASGPGGGDSASAYSASPSSAASPSPHPGLPSAVRPSPSRGGWSAARHSQPALDFHPPQLPGAADLGRVGGRRRAAFLFREVIDGAEADRLELQPRIHIDVDAAIDGLLQARPRHRDTMAAHQHDRFRAERFRQGGAQLAVADQKIAAVADALADFEDRRFGADEAAHVKDRPQLMRAHHAERNDGMGVAVHDRDHVRANAIDFA